ncbi:MAG TPA: hypothetical protein VGP46_11195 [Acidimicrobiales bacterium]|nr:hypothetical protein [Acidimicrobiales bacterium]
MDLVAVVEATGSVGRAQGIHIDYTANGTSYYLQTQIALVIRVAPGRCFG